MLSWAKRQALNMMMLITGGKEQVLLTNIRWLDILLSSHICGALWTGQHLHGSSKQRQVQTRSQWHCLASLKVARAWDCLSSQVEWHEAKIA